MPDRTMKRRDFQKLTMAAFGGMLAGTVVAGSLWGNAVRIPPGTPVSTLEVRSKK